MTSLALIPVPMESECGEGGVAERLKMVDLGGEGEEDGDGGESAMTIVEWAVVRGRSDGLLQGNAAAALVLARVLVHMHTHAHARARVQLHTHMHARARTHTHSLKPRTDNPL